MTYFPHDFLSATSVSYKTCLIVLDKPRPASGSFCCTGRLVLGGRLNLPLPPSFGSTPDEAREAALRTGREAVDRLEAAL